MRHTRKLAEPAQENQADSISMLAYKAVHADSGAARAEAYQKGVRSFTPDELSMIGTQAPDLFLRYAARMQSYLTQGSYHVQTREGQLEQRLDVPTATDLNRELHSPKGPDTPLEQTAYSQGQEYQEAM